jgi:hypothetical protein
MIMKILILLTCLVVLLGYGCVEPILAPPHDVAGFTEKQQNHPQQYASSTVMLYNIQRVLDPDLPAERRVASLELISSLVGPNGKLPVEISSVLTQDDCPPALKKLITDRGVGVAAVTNHNPTTVISNASEDDLKLALSQLAEAPAGPKRTATLRWLIEHPRREVLPNLVKLWASEALDSSDEQLFRQAVTKLGAGQWPDVLLNSLNARKFAARGSALAVLSGRSSEIDLLNRIKRLTPNTVSVQAMQAFARKFGYIPAHGGELLACVILNSSSEKALDAPSRLAKQWGAKYGYKFNIRDFHLLKHLAADPLRNKIGRNELVKQIVAKLGPRKHVARTGLPFSKQAVNMTMSDLWNVLLLDEMLRRPRVSLALKILADRLRAGLSSPRSGLVFYEGGKASAKLYPQTIDSTRGDRDHLPEREFQRAGFDALCHLHTRFEKVFNGDVASASKRELAASQQANFYGLVVSSIDSGTFSAFYYNPKGSVVSLGLFAFGK